MRRYNRFLVGIEWFLFRIVRAILIVSKNIYEYPVAFLGIGACIFLLAMICFIPLVDPNHIPGWYNAIGIAFVTCILSLIVLALIKIAQTIVRKVTESPVYRPDWIDICPEWLIVKIREYEKIQKAKWNKEHNIS